MNSANLIAPLLAGSFLTLAAPAAMSSEHPGNPFRVIVESNIFRLIPIPPEPSPQPVAPDPLPPQAEVMLTGIHTIFGPPQALIEVTEHGAGKPGKAILREGEGEGPIRVLAIDVEKSLVRIRNGAVETNLTFAAVKQAGPVTPMPKAFIRPPPHKSTSTAEGG